MELAPNVIVKAVEADLVLLDLSGGTYFKLNETGAFLLERIRSGDTPGEAAAALTRHFDVGLEAATRDLDKLLKTLQQKRLLCDNTQTKKESNNE